MVNNTAKYMELSFMNLFSYIFLLLSRKQSGTHLSKLQISSEIGSTCQGQGRCIIVFNKNKVGIVGMNNNNNQYL